MDKQILHTASAEETEAVGAALARRIRDKYGNSPCFVAMEGDLGAGKTAFVRGFASVLSPGSRVKSPTYAIVNEYRMGAYPLFHFDLYRLEDADGLESIGFDEYLASGTCIAEWSENLGEDRPAEFWTVRIEKTGENTRCITIISPEEETAC